MPEAQNLAAVDRAHAVDSSIRKGCQATRTALMALGGLLFEAFEEGWWKLLGYKSEREWLASPGIELSYPHAKACAQVYRELVVDAGVDQARLAGLDVRKAQAVLPAIRDEKVTVDEALSDCATLSRSDLSEKYSGDPNAPLNAEDEPVREKCPTCGGWKKT